MLDKNNPLPLYYQVKEDLLAKIEEGIYKVGDVIPSETELQDIYEVSRITIRRAIQQLVLDGFLSTQQGKGTFVSQPKATQELNVISNWADTMRKQGMRPETKSIEYCEEPCPEAVAVLLDVERGQNIYKIQRLRYANGEPICIMINYLLPEVVPGLIKQGIIGESLYDTLEYKYNVVLKKAVEKVEARAAKKEEAALLQIKTGAPLLHVTRTTYDDNDKAIEVVYTVSRADRYAYVVNLIGRPKK